MMIERAIFHVLAGDKAYSPASFDNNESTMNEILISTLAIPKYSGKTKRFVRQPERLKAKRSKRLVACNNMQLIFQCEIFQTALALL